MLGEADPIGGKGNGVEMDEAYFGGSRKGGGGRRLRNDKGEYYKTPVVGMAERKGRVRAVTVQDTKSATLLETVREHVLPKSTVFTDEYNSYDGMGRMREGYEHRRINHSAKVYVMGDVHTNTIEGFWSLVKNGVRGVYHSVGSSYLQSYLDEYSFRYNRRFDSQPMFISFLKQIEKSDSVTRREVFEVEPF